MGAGKFQNPHRNGGNKIPLTMSVLLLGSDVAAGKSLGLFEPLCSRLSMLAVIGPSCQAPVGLGGIMHMVLSVLCLDGVAAQ